MKNDKKNTECKQLNEYNINNDKNKIDTSKNNNKINSAINYNSNNDLTKSTSATSKKNTQHETKGNLNKNKNMKEKYDNIKSLDFIKEIIYGHYIIYLIGGLNNSLYLYDLHEQTLASKLNPYSVEIINKNNSIEIVLSCVNSIYFCNLNSSRGISQINEKKYPSLKFFETIVQNKKYQITYGSNGVLVYENLCSSKTVRAYPKIIFEEPVKGGILISNNIFAFVSSNIFSKKEKRSKIFFYIIKTFEIRKIEEIEFNHTVNLTINNLSLMEYTKKDKSYKLLFCACKKYTKNQKNGILLINYNYVQDKGLELNYKFKKTGNFEVYCFWQISVYPKNQIFNLDKIKKIRTNYCLIGGFEKDKGVIKIYKLIYSKNKKIYIKFVKNAILKDRNGVTYEDFRGPVSCIIQSKVKGMVLVTTWGDNIHVFNEPDIITSIKKYK